MRILIVEDSADLAEAMSELLIDAGHSVAVRGGEAPTLSEIVKLVQAMRFEVITIDLGLDGLDGASLIDAIGTGPGAPAVLLCTGAGPRRVEPLREKVAAVLIKPFTLEGLLEAVSHVERGRPRAADLHDQPRG